MPVAFAKQKFQELISGYTKTQDYLEVCPIVIPHYFGCISLYREYISVHLFWYYFVKFDDTDFIGDLFVKFV